MSCGVLLSKVQIKAWAWENKLPIPENTHIPIVYYMPAHPMHLQKYPSGKFQKEVEEAVKNIADKISVKHTLQLSELHIMAAHNDIPGLSKKLEEDSVNIDIIDKHQRTPLFYAAQNAHVLAMILLLSKGANLRHRDVDGQTFLDTLFHFRLFIVFKKLGDGLFEQCPDISKQVLDLLFLDNNKTAAWAKQIHRYEKNNEGAALWFDRKHADYRQKRTADAVIATTSLGGRPK